MGWEVQIKCTDTEAGTIGTTGMQTAKKLHNSLREMGEGLQQVILKKTGNLHFGNIFLILQVPNRRMSISKVGQYLL